MNPIKKIVFALSTVLLIIITGTIGFMYLEGYNILDAIAVTIATLTTSTVGFGNLVPHTVSGKILTLMIITLGVSLVAYVFGSVVGIILEGQLKNIMGRTKMLKKISSLENHIIVCGAGRVGQHVVSRLVKEDVPFVVIDKNPEIIAKLTAEGILAIEGDAAEDEVLEKVGIKKARGLITALPGDADNVFVALTSKELNPHIKVVARANHVESQNKLIRAGADKVISPSVIGGRRMAISMLKPVSVDFVETLIHQGFEIEIEEIVLGNNSPLAGKCLKESGIKQKTGAMVVAIKRGEDIINNPSADDVIMGGDLLIVLGTRSQLAELEAMASPR
ncbi:potassium channel family protein [Thermincola ferriacetica]